MDKSMVHYQKLIPQKINPDLEEENELKQILV